MFRTIRLVPIAALLLAAQPAYAINKCVNAKGAVSYQDAPCARGSQSKPLPKQLETGSDGIKFVTVAAGASASFDVAIPQHWKAKSSRPQGVNTPTVRITPADRNELVLLMTFLPIDEPTADPAALLDNAMADIERQHANDSNSRATGIVPIQPAWLTGVGALISYRDTALEALDQRPPGEYVYMTTGAMIIESTVITFTLLTNSLDGDSYLIALAAVRNIIHTT